MTPQDDFFEIARRAAKRLREYALMTIESNVRRSEPEENQDQYWRQGQADLALATELAAAARHGKRASKQKSSSVGSP